MQFFPLCTSEIEVFEKQIDTMGTQNDHVGYVKHVLGRMCVLFILFGY